MKIRAIDNPYKEELRTGGLCRTWNTHEPEFKRILTRYLDHVEVRSRHTEKEGAVQLRWSRVTEPWIPFDREAVLRYETKESPKEFPEVAEARGKLMDIHKAHRTAARRDQWAAPPEAGHEVDQLAIDREGRLVLIELKDAFKRTANVYYAPFQLLQYVWEWHGALEVVEADLQKLIDARVAVGLTPPGVTRLTGGIRAAVGFGPECRTPEVKRRFDMVLDIANQYLPNGVAAIETWEHTDNGPRHVI